MAGDLTITAADVAVVEVFEQVTGPAAAAINAGQVVYLVAANGMFNLADGNGGAPLTDPEGVAVQTANQANITITVVRAGVLDVGDALAGMNYGDTVWLSYTAGAMADTDPGASIVVGEVIPGWAYGTADKLLRVDCR